MEFESLEQRELVDSSTNKGCYAEESYGYAEGNFCMSPSGYFSYPQLTQQKILNFHNKNRENI